MFIFIHLYIYKYIYLSIFIYTYIRYLDGDYHENMCEQERERGREIDMLLTPSLSFFLLSLSRLVSISLFFLSLSLQAFPGVRVLWYLDGDHREEAVFRELTAIMLHPVRGARERDRKREREKKSQECARKSNFS